MRSRLNPNATIKKRSSTYKLKEKPSYGVKQHQRPKSKLLISRFNVCSKTSRVKGSRLKSPRYRYPNWKRLTRSTNLISLPKHKSKSSSCRGSVKTSRTCCKSWATKKRGLQSKWSKDSQRKMVNSGRLNKRSKLKWATFMNNSEKRTRVTNKEWLNYPRLRTVSSPHFKPSLMSSLTTCRSSSKRNSRRPTSRRSRLNLSWRRYKVSFHRKTTIWTAWRRRLRICRKNFRQLILSRRNSMSTSFTCSVKSAREMNYWRKSLTLLKTNVSTNQTPCTAMIKVRPLETWLQGRASNPSLDVAERLWTRSSKTNLRKQGSNWSRTSRVNSDLRNKRLRTSLSSTSSPRT